MSQLNLYLVRHGETYLNFLRRFQGWSDAPLTAFGEQNGRDAGQRLRNVHFDAAYSSDLGRAVHTAKLVLAENHSQSPRVPVENTDFREQFFGSFDACVMEPTLVTLSAYHDAPIRNYTDFITEHGMSAGIDLFAKADPYHFADNSASLWQRLDRGLAMIREKHLGKDKNIIIVSHGLAIRAIAERFNTLNLEVTAPVQNGAISHFTMTDDALVLQSYNDTTTTITRH